MAYFVDEENKFVVYESPKTGGTTLRSWINLAGEGELELAGDAEYYYEQRNVYARLDDWGYSYSAFRRFEGYDTICIKRDPVSRFISCFADKVSREKHIPNCTVEELLDNFDEILARHNMEHPSMRGSGISFLRYHFLPQTYHLGEDRNYYTEIVDTSEISTKLRSFLQDRWNIELPDIHSRKQTVAKPTLSPEYEAKVRKMYADDYKWGWV